MPIGADVRIPTQRHSPANLDAGDGVADGPASLNRERKLRSAPTAATNRQPFPAVGVRGMDETPDITSGYADGRPDIDRRNHRPADPLDGSTPPLVTQKEGGEGGVPPPEMRPESFQGPSVQILDPGHSKPADVRLLQRGLRDARFGLTGLDKRRAKEITLADMENAETVKERQMAVRSLILMDKRDQDRDDSESREQLAETELAIKGLKVAMKGGLPEDLKALRDKVCEKGDGG